MSISQYASRSAMRKSVLTTACIVAAFTSASCSEGGASSAPGASTPSASNDAAAVPAASDAPVVPAASDDKNFATAVNFTRAVQSSDYAQAFTLAAPGSIAVRYIEQQKSVRQAQQINGDSTEDDTEPTIKPNRKAQSIGIEVGDLSYTWKDFAYDAKGRVESWTGAAGPVAKVLWSKGDTSEALGTTARLVSAYTANSGDLFIVIEYKATRAINFQYDTTYAAADGYKQKPTTQGFLDSLQKGEKTLGYYVFKNAEFGGIFHTSIMSSDLTKTGRLSLDVR